MDRGRRSLGERRRRRSWMTAVTVMLQMVEIDLGAADDPNLIFETPNGRGTPLEQCGVSKNFVVTRSSREGDGKGYISGDLDDTWKRDEVRQGRLLRPRLAMLGNYWHSMHGGRELRLSGVFDAFRRFADCQKIEFD